MNNEEIQDTAFKVYDIITDKIRQDNGTFDPVVLSKIIMTVIGLLLGTCLQQQGQKETQHLADTLRKHFESTIKVVQSSKNILL